MNADVSWASAVASDESAGCRSTRRWSRKGEGRSPQHHYSCLSFEQLAAIPVASVAATDCFLLLWIPLRSVFLVEPLMRAWGFAFSGAGFTWVKQNRSGVGWFMGGGYGTRHNVEICWLGRRGMPRRKSAGVRELIIAPVREHSRKPDEIYARIEAHGKDLIRVVARQQWPGWTCVGDEVGNFSGRRHDLRLSAHQRCLPARSTVRAAPSVLACAALRQAVEPVKRTEQVTRRRDGDESAARSRKLSFNDIATVIERATVQRRGYAATPLNKGEFERGQSRNCRAENQAARSSSTATAVRAGTTIAVFCQRQCRAAAQPDWERGIHRNDIAGKVLGR